jgi:hypothetical protein
VPVQALHVTARLHSFCWRVAQLAGEGGFALVTGAPGSGKSVALRILAEHLAAQRDIRVGVISRPQANLADFYREIGDLFDVELHPHNRWGGAKILRQRWQSHIDSVLSRPVLIVDEAQEMRTPVLCELRLLSSTQLDSHLLLTAVLSPPIASPIAPWIKVGWSPGCGPRRPSASSAASRSAANPSSPTISPSPLPPAPPACAASPCPGPDASCSTPPRTRSTSFAAGSTESAPPPAWPSPISTSR